MTAPASPSISESDGQAGQALAASRKIIVNRLMIAVLIAAICALWTAPLFVAAWFATIIAYEMLVTYALRKYVKQHLPMAAPATRAISVASVASGTIPVLTYYQLRQSRPGASMDEVAGVHANLESRSTMAARSGSFAGMRFCALA